MKPLLLVSLALILLMLAAGCIGNNTPYKKFELDVNESLSIPYTVAIGFPYADTVYKSPGRFGYMILSTPVPGAYNVVVSTNNREDKIGLQWSETFQQQELVGDKFEKHLETHIISHWNSEKDYRCISDRYNDCVMGMTQAQYDLNPELQIYIVGHGSGMINITRVG